jgi:hypothetical protein
MEFTEQQLTFNAQGHTINNTQIFSPDDQWIVFDTRNDDGGIRGTGSIEMVNVHSGEIRTLYKTTNQTQYGPGVGAATFSPAANRVLFLHGIRNADQNRPYDFSRRTGVAIDIDHPFQPIFEDARNIVAPFTPGALRGGTHAHSWSGDGKRISCTYNDYVLEQAAKKDSTIKDLRTVVIMAPGKVTVPENGEENNNGDMFSAAIVKVTPTPICNSDDIDKAFDETWIGKKGYQKTSGEWQPYAIAFQGNVRDEQDKTKTEIFVADIPTDITRPAQDAPIEGTSTTRPNPPYGTTQRRITHTPDGVQGPRHWLRSTSDGKLIAFLAKDNKGIVQVFAVSSNGGNIKQLTFNDFPVQTSFNFSPDDQHLAYIADNSIFINDLRTNTASRITKKFPDAEAPVNGVVWSHDGKALACNRYATTSEGRFLQIFLMHK